MIMTTTTSLPFVAMGFPPDFVNGLAGGMLIGLGSVLALAATGKVPGISGVLARALRPRPGDFWWRVVFLAGLVTGAGCLILVNSHAALYRVPDGRSWWVYGVAGLIVGFGTRLGGGCTSGHGVCGIGAGARDSVVATAVFMLAAMLTVFVLKFAITAASR